MSMILSSAHVHTTFCDGKNTAEETSSGVPSLHRGVASRSESFPSSVSPRFMSVSMTPGSTQFTVMPDGPSSFASAEVNPRKADLEAE